ncbi:MAG: AMIN domain-containing protein [Campylobacterota bacterium]|nr:AMIN domain-containing protein [Campylobacterota bacterium]
MRLLFIVFIGLISLHGRENPFFPSQNEFALPITSNKKDNIQPLKSINISLPDSSRILQNITFEYKNLDGTVEKKVLQVDRSIDWHIPIFISQSFNKSTQIEEKKEVQFKKEIADFNFVSFYLLNKSLKIKTKDKLIRHFVLTNPHRLIMDFKADYSFKTMKKRVGVVPYEDIIVGNHRGYYRVVISLDGKYKINLDKKDSSYIVSCY